MEINHRSNHKEHQLYDVEQGKEEFQSKVDNFKEMKITNDSPKVIEMPHVHRTMAGKKHFGAKPNVSSIGGTAAKVAPQVVTSGLSFGWIATIVVIGVASVVGLGFGSFFLQQYYAWYSSFFGSELTKIRVLEDNIFISSTNGPYFTCPLGTPSNVSFCTLSEDMNFVLAVLAQNNTNINGTILASRVLDVNQGLTQDIINANTLASNASIAAVAASAENLATSANTTANGALSLASSANATANAVLGIATNANATANGALSLASSANTTANIALADVLALNTTVYAHIASDALLFASLNNSINNIGNNGTIYNQLSYQRLIRVEEFGNDATCMIGAAYPCLTLNGALTLLGNLSLSNVYSIEIGAGTFSSIPGGTSVPFPCNVVISGQGSDTVVSLAGQVMNSYSMNVSSTCSLTLRDIKFLLITSSTNLATVNLSPFIFTMTNVYIASTFSNNFIITGNVNSTLLLKQVTTDTNLQYLDIYDITIIADNLFVGGILRITCATITHAVIMHNFQVGINGFLINNNVASGLLQLYLYGGSNLFQQIWIINTVAGGATTLYGDETIGMIRNGGNYGPSVTGAGTFTFVRENSGYGIAYAGLIASYWTSLGFSVPVEVQTAIDDLVFYMNSVNGRLGALETMPPSHIIYIDFFGDDATCQPANPRLPCASPTKASSLIGNATDSNTMWIFQFSTGYWFLNPSFQWPCNVIFRGTENTYLYFNGTTVDVGKALGVNAGTCITKLLYLTIIPQTAITIDFSSLPSLTYIEIDWLNCTINFGAFPITFIGNGNYNLMQIDTMFIGAATFFTLYNFNFNGINDQKYLIPFLFYSNNGNSLYFEVKNAIFYSYLNISSIGAVTTLIKLYKISEEQNTPLLFNVYGNNTLTVLECDDNSCGLTNVGLAAFTGSASVQIRGNTDLKGTYVRNINGDFITANFPSITFPAPAKALMNDVGVRLTNLETTTLTKVTKITATATANTTTTISVPLTVTTVYLFACGAGSAGMGNALQGGNSGAALFNFPFVNRGNITVTVGYGGQTTSDAGQDTVITDGVVTITLEGGQSPATTNRGGHLIFNGFTIITGAAGGAVGAGLTSPGNPAVFNGGMYGGAGGGNRDTTSQGGTNGGYAALNNAGGVAGTPNSPFASGPGGASSPYGIGGTGANGNTVQLNGAPATGFCAGGGSGNTNSGPISFGGAGSDGMFYLVYYI